MKKVIPPNHIGFKALPLAKELDEEIIDCAVAFIEPQGGGPTTDHIHEHDHLFTVISGEIEVMVENTVHTLKSGCSLRVSGSKLHSVWNRGRTVAKVIGTSLRNI